MYIFVLCIYLQLEIGTRKIVACFSYLVNFKQFIWSKEVHNLITINLFGNNQVPCIMNKYICIKTVAVKCPLKILLIG